MNWLIATAAIVWLALLATVVDVAVGSTVLWAAAVTVCGTAAWIVARPLWKP